MHTLSRFFALLLAGASVWAAEFQNGQAARAVIGQESFSARDASITPTTLSISNGRLYVADSAHRLLTYDVTQVAGAKEEPPQRADSICALCESAPIASVNQSVLPGVAAVSVVGRTVIIADTQNRRVLIWRDSSAARAVRGPDVVLGHANPDGGTISGATLVEPLSVAYDGKRLFVGDGALHRVLIWNSLPVSDTQPADAVLGQQNLTNSNKPEVAAPDTIDRPAALASDGTNLFVADAALHRVLVFTPGDMPLANNAVLNSASFAPGPIAPGTLITVSGNGLSETSESAPDEGEQPLPRVLGGVEVFLDGVSLPLLSVSPSQIRAQVPYELGEASAASLYVRTQFSGGAIAISNATAVKLLPAAPGLFAFGGHEPRSGIVLHAGASQDETGSPVTADNPAKPGEILTLWAAGLGLVDSGDNAGAVSAGTPYDGPAAPVQVPVSARIDGRLAQVVAATLPHGAIGVYEVRVQVPYDLTAGRKAALVISQQGQLSNAVTIPIENTIQ